MAYFFTGSRNQTPPTQGGDHPPQLFVARAEGDLISMADLLPAAGEFPCLQWKFDSSDVIFTLSNTS